MSETNIDLNSDDFELPDIDALDAYVTRLQAGSAILYSLINEIHALHSVDDNNTCIECKTAYPCNTAQIMLSTMVEETPAE